MSTQSDSLNRRIDGMYSAAEQANEAWHGYWADGLAYILGDQVGRSQERDDSRYPRVQINYLYPAVMQEIAVQMARSTTVQAIPVESGDEEAAELWSNLLQWWWQVGLGMPSMQIAASLDARIYGHAVFRVTWDHRRRWNRRQRRWQGGPKLGLICPEHLYVDPDFHGDDINEAGYVISRRWIETDELIRQYPHMRTEIIGAAGGRSSGDLDGLSSTVQESLLRFSRESYDAERETQSRDDGRRARDADRAGRLLGLLRSAHGFDSQARTERRIDTDSGDSYASSIPLTEVFFRDYTEGKASTTEYVPRQEMIQHPAVAYDSESDILTVAKPDAMPDDSGVTYQAGEVLTSENWPQRTSAKWKEPLYPYGRHVVRIGDDVILNPRDEDQVWPLERWPFAVVRHLPLPRTWRGLNATEMGCHLQDLVNDTASHLQATSRYLADPAYAVEEGTLLGAEDGDQSWGDALDTGPGSLIKTRKGRSSGVQRISGEQLAPAQVEMFHLLTRELQDQTGAQDVAIGRSMRGQQTAEEVATLATNARIRSALPAHYQDQGARRSMRIVAEMLGRFSEPGDVVMILGPDGQEFEQALAADMIGMDIDVRLEITSVLPFDQERRKADAERLFSMIGPAMLPELLEAFDVDNAEEILERHEQFAMLPQLIEFINSQAAMAAADGQSQETPDGQE